ncbi:hypothetical protein JKP88DRAFT_354095 [Tribonema minus]|uniref:BTB domain-containing protein n=1 Tax=Tribonema minus TaxID=303371 RepID=A0A836CJI0_9STRA|nr:hypothetical protein JKP88DRAFT_354095 [Tribonema minus]
MRSSTPDGESAGRKRKRDDDGDAAQATDSHEHNAEVREAIKELQLHAAVLITHSSVLHSKLSRWTGPERPARIQIELENDAEVDAFEDVVWAMYHGKLPAEEQLTIQRALTTAQVADTYAAETPLCLAAKWLDAQADLPWDEALRLFDAPCGVRERLHLRNALSSIMKRVGDLELATNDELLRQQLTLLPEAALGHCSVMTDSLLEPRAL